MATATQNTGAGRARRARGALLGGVAAIAALGLAITTSVKSDAESAEPLLPTVTGEAEITLSMSVEPGQPVPLALIRKKAAKQYDDKGALGQGIDVALIDSGVTQVPGLDQPGKVIYGPDRSNEGGHPNLANLDTFGHGTHLAGIIAGDDGDRVLGVAPQSRLVSLKVAGATGETHIAQVIAGIDWVVEHKNDNGMNIRVLNLSLGTGGIPTTAGDPFSAAVERAWNAGIVVVASAGNRGNYVGGIDSPALSPYVMAVGATESYHSWGRGDTAPTWTSGGNTYRTPDVLAPGRSIMSLRVPGSFLDQLHPQAVVDDKYFVGSGSSQAAAVQTGYVAGLLSRYPSLTPDQVKYLFSRYAKDVTPGDLIDGEGKINPKASADATTRRGGLRFRTTRSPSPRVRVRRTAPPGLAVAGTVRAGPAVPGRVRPGRVRAGRVRPGRVRPGPVRAGRARAGRVRAGRVRPGPVRPGPVRPGRVRPGRAPLGRASTTSMRPSRPPKTSPSTPSSSKRTPSTTN